MIAQLVNYLYRNQSWLVNMESMFLDNPVNLSELLLLILLHGRFGRCPVNELWLQKLYCQFKVMRTSVSTKIRLFFYWSTRLFIVCTTKNPFSNFYSTSRSLSIWLNFHTFEDWRMSKSWIWQTTQHLLELTERWILLTQLYMSVLLQV